MKKDDFNKLSEAEKKAYIESVLPQANPEKFNKKSFITTGWPDSPFKAVIGLLGLPIERDDYEVHHPGVIYTFIALWTLVQIFLSSQDSYLVFDSWGFTPAKFYQHFFLTLITSFFIHGGWLHLIGNAYYFYVFGDDVEDDLDLTAFFTLIFGGHICGLLCHAFFGGQSAIPLIGASAGISALMGYYMFRFRDRQISFNFSFYIWLHVPVLVALLWKFSWEFLMAIASTQAYTETAFWAHVGGAAFGAAYYFMKK